MEKGHSEHNSVWHVLEQKMSMALWCLILPGWGGVRKTPKKRTLEEGEEEGEGRRWSKDRESYVKKDEGIKEQRHSKNSGTAGLGRRVLVRIRPHVLICAVLQGLNCVLKAWGPLRSLTEVSDMIRSRWDSDRESWIMAMAKGMERRRHVQETCRRSNC